MPPALAGFLDVNIKWTEESDIELSLKKKKKKREEKTRNITKTCLLSAVVVYPTDMMSTVLSEQFCRSEVLHCSRSACWSERLLFIENHLKSFI